MINIQYCKNYDVMSLEVANIVESRIDNGLRNIGLPTGNTPIKLYEILTSRNIDWSNINTFNLDEYVGVHSNHRALFKNFMHLHFHSKVNVKNIYFPTNDYDDVIKSQGGLDLTILGLGLNGHIAYNEPGSTFDSLTRTVVLEQQTRDLIRKEFDSEWELPRYAISMGIQTILNSKEIILMAQGPRKLDILQRSIWSEPDIHRPCSAIQLHDNVTVFYCD